jgi:4-hydroxythreonine-4-phosphate dehydrogenase
MSEKAIKAGISHGDINGIAYELILKLSEDMHLFETCIPIFYGSTKILAYHRKVLNLPAVNFSSINRPEDAGAHRLNVLNVTNDELTVELGKPTPEGLQAADLALARALDDLAAGKIDVLLTLPAQTDPVATIEVHTAHENKSLKILVSNDIRIALATGNVPLSDVPALLTEEALTGKIIALRSSLIRDFQITFPRIAVLALNPAGAPETLTTAAIQAASDAGVQCFGPYVAADFFASGRHQTFDAVLALYHDQGMIAFRSLVDEEHAYLIANLPHIVAVPNLPASFDKTGKNESSPRALREALYLAVDACHNRDIDRTINSNPLKKQYFDRGSDNVKLDLTKEDI